MALFSILLLIVVPANFIFALEETGHDVAESRIIGGSKIDITRAPYMAALQDSSGNLLCGGSIITPSVVLTAAHCILKIELWVNVGSTKWHGGELVKVSRAVIHEQYHNGTHDVALLFLDSRLALSDKIKTLDLSQEGHPPDGAVAFVSGWGGTTCEYSETPDLKGVYVTVYSDEECINIEDSEFLAGDEICAGNLGRATDDFWHGDSGGPLVYKGKQIGVVSRTRCKEINPNSFSYYAGIMYHRAWIEDKTKDFI